MPKYIIKKNLRLTRSFEEGGLQPSTKSTHFTINMYLSTYKQSISYRHDLSFKFGGGWAVIIRTTTYNCLHNTISQTIFQGIQSPSKLRYLWYIHTKVYPLQCLQWEILTQNKIISQYVLNGYNIIIYSIFFYSAIVPTPPTVVAH